MDKQILKVKILFVAICVLIVLFVWEGSRVLEDSRYLKTANVERYLAFLKYKLEFNGLNLPLEANTSQPAFFPETYSAINYDSKSIPVLFYKSDFPQTTDAIDAFKKQMFASKKAGYETVGAEQLYNFMHGNAVLPQKSFVLAFDNTKTGNFSFADPILKAVGYKAIMLASEDPKKKNGLDQIFATGKWDIQENASRDGYLIVPK